MMESQHYIPQFYLREFTDTETPNGYEPYVWRYEHESKKWKNKSPQNIALKPDFYSFVDQKGKRRDEIEKGLSIIEGKTASIYRNKIYNRQYLSNQEKATIAEFIALMVTCVPSFRNIVDSSTSEMAIRIMEMYKARPDATKKFKEEYERDIGKKLPDDFDESWLDPSRYKINTTKNFLLKTMVSLSEIAKIIFKMSWTFLHTTEKAWFITSDNPFSMRNPKSNSPWYGHGLMSQDIEVTIPLSKQICLLATWEKGLWPHINVPQLVVEELNHDRIEASDKFIISPRKDFIGSQYLKYKTEMAVL
ncbi:MAG TPA: DUF4238 domain-containing protein [Candidatus Wujingus californicus]|uniref:DUF4238 domain-containing protein n=1 Tax=Candidatus Wujingus californicus TaxID=3367618 RepID=UPI0040284710